MQFDVMLAAGVTLRHSADCNALLHLRHHWHAGLYESFASLSTVMHYCPWRWCTVAPLQGTPANISAWTVHCKKLESLGYIVVADSMGYLYSNLRGGLRKTHVFWNRVRNGPSRSSKVVDFGTNRKRYYYCYSNSSVCLSVRLSVTLMCRSHISWVVRK